METPKFFKKDKITLARELMESNEKLPFPGLNLESYNRLKEDEQFLLDNPDYTTRTDCSTPIDELIKKCEEQGLKIIYAKDGGNISLLPANSDNLGDNLMFKHLDINAIDNVKFQELANLFLK